MHCTKKMIVKKHASLINTIQYLLTVILLIFTSFFICNFSPQNIYTMITCLGHCCLTIRPSLYVKLSWVILQKQTQVYKYNCKKTQYYIRYLTILLSLKEDVLSKKSGVSMNISHNIKYD